MFVMYDAVSNWKYNSLWYGGKADASKDLADTLNCFFYDIAYLTSSARFNFWNPYISQMNSSKMLKIANILSFEKDLKKLLDIFLNW